MEKKQKVIIAPETILKYLINDDDKTDTMILCKTGDVDLMTSDLALYQALGSIKPYDDVKFHKLKKLFEVVDIVSYRETTKKEKPILTHDKVEKIRNSALRRNENV